MKRKIQMVMVAFCFLLTGVSSQPSFASDKPITLRYSNFFPPANKVSLLCEQWCKEVEKRTDGRVKVDYYPGATLTKPAQTYDSVKLGLADVGMSFTSYTIGRFPLTEVLDLPLGYKSAYAACMMSNAYYEKFRPKEFDDVKLLYLTTVPPHNIFTRTPVKNLEELKGLKIRATGTTGQIIEALGAAPVAMPMSEAYDALAKGVAEGVIGPFEPMKGFRLADVVKYGIPIDSAWSNTAFVVMNKNTWKKIPKDLQEIIEGINSEWSEKQARLWDELDAEGKTALLQKGGEIITLSNAEQARWTQAMRPIIDGYVEKMRGKNLPGEDALNFCVDFLKTHQ